MKQKAFVLGASGGVGRSFLSQHLDFDQDWVDVVGVASSRFFIFDASGIDKSHLQSIAHSREKAQEVFEADGKSYSHVVDLLGLIESDEVCFVDLTGGGEDLLEFHKKVIEKTNHRIVTANKNPVALGTMADFRSLTQDRSRYHANVTVMAGGGPVEFVAGRQAIGDEIVSVEGCFSGTLTYIMSELEKGEKPFSRIVREAKENGYTEPNPWDDLNGVDVGRKVLILARYAGHDLEFSDIVLHPLIEEHFGALSGDDFLKSLEDVDDDFEAKRKLAAEKGEVLRYVGSVSIDQGEVRLEVGLRSVSAQSAIGGLSSTENIMVAKTKILCDPIPHVIKSRGAGTDVTAAAIRVGLLTP